MTRPHHLLLLALMSGCVAAPSPEPRPEPGPDACGASGYQGLIGTNIAAVTLPADRLHRTIGPDDIITMDYNVHRVNFRHDASGVIRKVDCG